jgi:amino-acid N-acetyltransferase
MGQQTTMKSVPTGKEVTIRPAVVADAIAIANLVNYYASMGEMLPKSRYQVYQHIGGFVVAEIDNQVVGCGVLHVLWEDLAEVRSLAVLEEYKHRGLGTKMVTHLLQKARLLGLHQIFALTYVPGFFESMGFYHIEKHVLPQKIWIDCINCAKFPDCDEEALILTLED